MPTSTASKRTHRVATLCTTVIKGPSDHTAVRKSHPIKANARSGTRLENTLAAVGASMCPAITSRERSTGRSLNALTNCGVLRKKNTTATSTTRPRA